MSELPVIHENTTTSQKFTRSSCGVVEYFLISLAICSYEPLYLYSVKRSDNWHMSSMAIFEPSFSRSMRRVM